MCCVNTLVIVMIISLFIHLAGVLQVPVRGEVQDGRVQSTFLQAMSAAEVL